LHRPEASKAVDDPEGLRVGQVDRLKLAFPRDGILQPSRIGGEPILKRLVAWIDVGNGNRLDRGVAQAIDENRRRS
jgi:hypothetical protein